MDYINDNVEVFANKIFQALIKEDRFTYLVSGLKISIEITLAAAVLGVLLGLLTAICKLRGKGPLAALANGYITVIRGTPAVVQLTVIYFVILAKTGLPALVIASISFGINSGAYVAEIIRAGITAVDRGQMEAGRSLGLSYTKTMIYIVIPQAIKNVLPALGNEFIVLLKETSIAGYISIADLNKGGQSISSITYDYMVTALLVAYIYLLMTTSMASGLNRLERRLHRSD
jgi:His/Glu/Gln/Arg/opine family amino acid ABC transporter permease subunit